MKPFSPMLAATPKTERYNFPLLASPKIDGIRSPIINGRPISRSLKPFPNVHINSQFSGDDLIGLDGELIIGSPTAQDACRKTSSVAMSKANPLRAQFYVFDDFTNSSAPFKTRIKHAEERVRALNRDDIVLVQHQLIRNKDELFAFEQECLEAGYEGAMIRDPGGIYKYGRSTENEGLLLKIKRFADAEAVITDFIPMIASANPLEIGGKIVKPESLTGALRVTDIATGKSFDIGSGLTTLQRFEFWQNKADLIGKAITYKFFPQGVKDLPRHPVFKGFRNPLDAAIAA